MPVPESGVRDLLAAIRDALSPPWPPEGEDVRKRDRLVASRAAFMCGVLRREAEGTEALNLELDARIIREEAARPLPYQPEGGQS